MSYELAIRAWKDEAFRDSLSADAASQLPEHPAGVIVIPDELLDAAGGEDLAAPPPISTVLTSLPCLGAASATISCIKCDTTLWHGSCYASSIGCCPPAQLAE